jgi:hypothetical protein
MKSLSGASIALILHVSFFVPTHLWAASNQPVAQDHAVPTPEAVWQSTKAEHVYGLPDIKHNKKGTLTLSADALTFTDKSGNACIPRSSVAAMSAGNQRVELWGMGGRILRMTIPDGGGVAAAAVMPHRVDMLTVEFNDSRSGYHAAVFFLPANEADRALENFALAPGPARTIPDAVCQNAPIEPKSVLVSAPNWDHAEVPAAYRALVYEHLVDRIQTTKDVAHVYRDGEGNGKGACPQYIVHISIAAFKEGSSVKRAYLWPAGMFVGTTQMKFDVAFTDASGKLNTSEQITATIRGESESTGVADHVAKAVAKRYAKALENAAKSNAARTSTPTS